MHANHLRTGVLQAEEAHRWSQFCWSSDHHLSSKGMGQGSHTWPPTGINWGFFKILLPEMHPKDSKLMSMKCCLCICFLFVCLLVLSPPGDCNACKGWELLVLQSSDAQTCLNMRICRRVLKIYQHLHPRQCWSNQNF